MSGGCHFILWVRTRNCWLCRNSISSFPKSPADGYTRQQTHTQRTFGHHLKKKRRVEQNRKKRRLMIGFWGEGVKRKMSFWKERDKRYAKPDRKKKRWWRSEGRSGWVFIFSSSCSLIWNFSRRRRPAREWDEEKRKENWRVEEIFPQSLVQSISVLTSWQGPRRKTY